MPVSLPDLLSTVYKLRYIQKSGEPRITEGASGRCQIQLAPLAGGKFTLKVLELCFLRQPFQTDQVILPAVIGERYVVRDFGRQFAGGGTI